MPIGGNISLANGDVMGSLLLSSLDDESFVVLERSTANDSMDLVTSPSTQAVPGSFPVFNNLASNAMARSRTSHVSQTIPIESLCLPFESGNISVSAEEIDKRLQELLQENITLKENLYQTNLAMKQQLSTVALLQDRALDVQRNHTSKFEETKALILKLTSEKNELQETINVMTEEMRKIREEIKKLQELNGTLGTEKTKAIAEKETLKNELCVAAEAFKCLNENVKKMPTHTQPSPKEVELHQVVDQLTRKLEAVERARRQQEFDIDRLQAQLGRAAQELTDTQRRLAHTESDLQIAKTQTQFKSQEAISYGENMAKYEELLKQLKSSIHQEDTKFNSLQSWIQTSDSIKNSTEFEISELRRLLSEEQSESVARKENFLKALAMVHEMIGDYQKIGEQLERAKTDHALKESRGAAYNETQRKGFTEKIDSLTSQLVQKEEELGIAERHLASLQEAVRLQNDEKKDDGQVKTLKEQVQLLTVESVAKEEKLKSLTQEISHLKTETQNLRASSDTVAVFEEQAKIYQADFEAERKSREVLVAEKDRILEDLRHLQRRNQDLIDELSRLRQGQTPQAPQAPPATQTADSRNREEPQTPTPRLDNVSDTQNERQIFHEKQEGYLCAQHCLNALLQGPHFNAVDLAELAQEMDFAEKTRMAEAGYDGKDYQSFIKKPSENMDDTGYFSVQVISCALEIWGLDMIPYKSSDPRAVSARSNKKTVDAFICNSNSHWFTIRRLGKQWYNLNSTLCKPEPISDLYLELFLEEFQQEGNVFIVLGPLPDSYGKNNNYAIIGLENHAKPKRTEESGKTEEPDDTDYLNLSVENVSESLLTKEQFKEFLVHRGQKWFRK